jgi:hypothetical protein
MLDITELLGKSPAEIEGELSSVADPLVESGEIPHKDIERALCKTVEAIASYLYKRVSD